MHRGGYSESDALNNGIETEEIILDQLPEPEQESEEDMATGDKLVNLDDLKVAYDKQQEETNSLKSALNTDEKYIEDLQEITGITYSKSRSVSHGTEYTATDSKAVIVSIPSGAQVCVSLTDTANSNKGFYIYAKYEGANDYTRITGISVYTGGSAVKFTASNDIVAIGFANEVTIVSGTLSMNVSVSFDRNLSDLYLETGNLRKETENKTKNFSWTQNLYNIETAERNKKMNLFGEKGDDNDRILSDYIPVIPGSTLCFSNNGTATQATFVTLFTANKTVVSGVGGVNVTSYTIPDYVYFVRISYLKANTKFQVEYDSVTAYKDCVTSVPDKSVEGYSDVKQDANGLIGNEVNLVDEQLLSPGYMSSSGSVTSSDSYHYTDYIRVYSGDKIYCNQIMRFIAAFDKQKTVIPALGTDTMVTVGNYFEVLPGVHYIRVSLETSHINPCIFRNKAVSAYSPSGTGLVKAEAMQAARAVQSESTLGQNGYSATAETLTSSDNLQITEFPYFIKKNVGMSFNVKLSSALGNNDEIYIGKGKIEWINNARWIKITKTRVIVGVVVSGQEYYYEDATRNKEHGLSINNYLSGSIFMDNDGTAYLTLNTCPGGTYETGNVYQTTFPFGNVFAGVPFLSTNFTVTGVKLSVNCKDLQKSLWAFGDSYFSVDDTRVTGQLRNMGYFDFMVDGHPGIDAVNMYTELMRCLALGRPKYLVWCLGMNGATLDSRKTLTKLKELCEKLNIILIPEVIPIVAEYNRTDYNTDVKNSGLQYIDGALAVGSQSDGTWYDGYLSQDGIHPTEAGAIALAERFLLDCPQLLQCWSGIPESN